jgi:hypothetical protein
MTAIEPAVRPSKTSSKTPSASTRSGWRPWLAFGTGVAVEISSTSLEIATVRVRPNGAELLRTATIEHIHERPAAEWSTQYQAAVRGIHSAGVTVLLPRAEVIVRQVSLPAVSSRELEGALALRLRTLHPFADDDVAWCWAPVRGGALVGLTRLATLSRYEALFAEAGIPVASFSFSATILHSALRIYGEPAIPVFTIARGARNASDDSSEIYGENAAGAIFSGEFTGAAERAIAAAIAQLRLPQETAPVPASELLHIREAKHSAVDRPLLFAAAVAAGASLLARPANFLPPERRAGQNRLWLIPTAVLALLLILAIVAGFAIGPYRDRRTLETLHGQIKAAEPGAFRAAALDKRIAQERDQIQLLDQFRGRAQADFEILNELTRIVQPPAWTSSVEIYPDYVIIAGEAEQAASLLKMLDSSPYFQDSQFTSSVTRSVSKNEVFRIKTMRRHK